MKYTRKCNVAIGTPEFVYITSKRKIPAYEPDVAILKFVPYRLTEKNEETDEEEVKVHL